MDQGDLEARVLIFTSSFVKELVLAIHAFYLDATKKAKINGDLVQNNSNAVTILSKGIGAGLGAGAGLLCGLFGVFGGIKAGAMMGGALANKLNAHQNHKVAKKVNSLFGAKISTQEAATNLKASLATMALEMFQNFEWQFMCASTQDGWSLAMERLASEAVHRVISYLKGDVEEFDTNSLYKGVLYGESKGVLRKGQSLVGVNGQDWNTASLFAKTMVFSSPVVSFEESSASLKFDYGFRLPFQFELDEFDQDLQGYDRVLYEYVIVNMTDEEKMALHQSILAECRAVHEVLNVLHMEYETLREDLLAGQEQIQSKLEEIEHSHKVYFQDNAERGETTLQLLRQQQHHLKLALKNLHHNQGAIHLSKFWPKQIDVSPAIILRKDGYNAIVKAMHDHIATSRVLILSGMQGIGKTTACRWFISKSEDEYDHIFWMEADPSMLESQVKLLSDKMLISLTLNDGETPKSIATLFCEIYEALQSKKCLFILANVENPNDIKDCVSYEKRHAFMITTKHHNWEMLNGKRVPKMVIGLPTEEETVDFICVETGETPAQGKLLAQKLGNLPLAVCQAISAIKTLGIAIKDYLAEFQAEAEQILEKDSKDSVLTTWSLSLKRLKDQHGDASAVALELFHLASFLHFDDIPLRLFMTLGYKKIELMKSMDMLLSYSLLFWKDQGNSFTIHKLIQEITRIQIERNGTTEACLSKLVHALELCIENEHFIEPYRHHLNSLEFHIQGHHRDHSVALKRLRVADLIQTQDYKAAQIKQAEIVLDLEASTDLNPLIVLKSQTYLAKISCYFNEHMVALRCLQGCMHDLKAISGDLDKPSLELQCLMGIEELHEYLAKKRSVKGRRTLENLMPKLYNHPEFGVTAPLTLLLKFAFGTACLVFGDEVEGFKVLEEFNVERQAVCDVKPEFMPSAPQVKEEIIDFLSHWYQSLILWNGRPNEAKVVLNFEPLLSKHVILTKYLEIFGDHPPVFGWTFIELLYNIFCMVQPYNNIYNEALEIYECILEQRQKHLGIHHGQTQMAEAELIMLLAIAGNSKDASKKLKQTQRDTIHENDHVTMVEILRKLAQVQLERATMDKLRIMQSILDQLKGSFGVEHNVCQLTLQYMRSLDSSDLSPEDYCSLFASPVDTIKFAIQSDNASLLEHVLEVDGSNLDPAHNIIMNQIAAQGSAAQCEMFMDYLRKHTSPQAVIVVVNNMEQVDNAPLAKSILQGRGIELIRFLIANGAHLESSNNTGWRPLHFGVLRERLDVVELLIQQGCDLKARTNQRNNALNIASRRNQGTSVAECIIRGAKERLSLEKRRIFINDVNEVGDTPLLSAALKGNLALVQIYQANSGDMFATNNRNWNIMHFGALRSHQKLVEYAIEAGLDVNSKAHDGRRPVELAASTCGVDFMAFFIEMGADYWTNSGVVLQKAMANTQNPGLFQFLVQQLREKFSEDTSTFQSHVNQMDKDGDTVLMMAAYYKKNDCVNQLIRNCQVDHTVVNYTHRHNVLHWSALGGNEAILPLLKDEMSMSFRDQDDEGLDVLMLAIKSESTDFALKILRDYNAADFLRLNQKLQTCLHLACIHFNEPIVNQILKHFHICKPGREELKGYIHLEDHLTLNSYHYSVHGADSRVQTLFENHGANRFNNDWTELHWAALMNDPAQIKTCLTEAKAKRVIHIDIKTKSSRSALFIAVELGNISALNTLVDLGAKWNTRTRIGRNVFHAAVGTKRLHVLSSVWDKIQSKLEGSDLVRICSQLLDAPDDQGFTPLLLAVQLGELSLVDYLFRHGADTCSLTTGQKSVVDLASELTPANEELIQWLLARGHKKISPIAKLSTGFLDLNLIHSGLEPKRSKMCSIV